MPKTKRKATKRKPSVRRTRSKHVSFRVRPETFKVFMQGLKSSPYKTKTEYLERLIMHGVDHV